MMAELNATIGMTILNVNGLNTSNKRILSNYIKSQDPKTCGRRETLNKKKNKQVQEQKKMYQANNKNIRKTDFKTRNVIKDKEDYFTVIIESAHQGERKIVNMCSPNNTASKHLKQKNERIKGSNRKIPHPS